MMEDVCVLCGVIVPEDRMICPHCENDLSDAEERYEQILAERVEAAKKPKLAFWRKKYGKVKSK